MRVIDLINKVANGEEVPEKIRYNEKLYSFVKGVDYQNECGGFLIGGSVCICPEDLNSEVKIIEESQKQKIPEKIDKKHFLNNKSFDQVDIDLNFIIDKINEILDYLEK